MSIWIREKHIEDLGVAYREYKCKKTEETRQQYHEFGIVKRLEDEKCDDAMECVELIETAHLPEITLLICMCNRFSHTEYAPKYKKIRKLYLNAVANNELEPYFDSEIDIFREEIVELADDVIINKLENYINICEKNWKDNKKELNSTKRSIKALKKELEEYNQSEEQKTEQGLEPTSDESDIKDANNNISENNVIRKCEKSTSKVIGKEETIESDETEFDPVKANEEITELENKKEELNKIVKQLKDKYEKLTPFKEILQEANKELAAKHALSKRVLYGKLREIHLPPEEKYVRKIIAKEELGSDFKLKMGDRLFSDAIARNLGKPEYYDVAVESILWLFHNGYIDLSEELGDESNHNMFFELLREMHDEFLEVLIYRFPQTMDRIREDNDYGTYLEISLIQEIETVLGKGESYYYRLWECIEDPEIWKYIIDYFIQRRNEKIEYVLAVITQSCQGRAADAFLEAYLDNKLSQAALVKEILQLKSPNIDIIMKIVTRMDKRTRLLERDLKRSEASRKRNTTKVFRALSKPEEMLEYLAVNVRDTSSEISNDIMANQLMSIVEKMRSGLSELEVYPVEEIERWKSSNSVPFNEIIHLYDQGGLGTTDMVTIKSLGFRYNNGDDDVQYPAHVVGQGGNENGI